jgi:TRAP-type C4-dicarboxylate transport system permease small subunit
VAPISPIFADGLPSSFVPWISLSIRLGAAIMLLIIILQLVQQQQQLLDKLQLTIGVLDE